MSPNRRFDRQKIHFQSFQPFSASFWALFGRFDRGCFNTRALSACALKCIERETERPTDLPQEG